MIGPATLEAIRSEPEGIAYPCDMLIGCKDALVLFAAGFHGKQDAFWIAEAGLAATCVDNDAQKLLEMRHVYPIAWEFITDDAFEYIATIDRRWDVVSVDCPSGAFDRCADLIGDWCRLARHAVVLGTGPDTPLEAPDGWTVTDRRHRSDYDRGVYWAVLERT